MKLYHLHLLGNHDELYKEGNELVIDKNKFNNRIYNRIYHTDTNVEIGKYEETIVSSGNLYNPFFVPFFSYGYDENDKISMDDVVDTLANIICNYGLVSVNGNELYNALIDSANIINMHNNIMAEMALEEYRRKNCNNLPSRLHSLFACSENGIDYWYKRIKDNVFDIYEIDVEDNPFVSSNVLLPSRNISYSKQLESAKNYFHPDEYDLGTEADEYLVQGKVKILKKIYEARKNNY